jgi:hypothetical protein
VPNLYFAGSEVGTVGVIGAMMGGMLCAMAIGGGPVRKLVTEAR